MLTLPAIEFLRALAAARARRPPARRPAASRSAASGALTRSVAAVSSRPRFEAVQPVLQVADDVIEADAAEANRRLVLAAGVGDDHDRTLAIEDRAGPGRVLAAEADVDAAGKMRGGELAGSRVSRICAAGPLQRQHQLQRHRVQLARQRLVQRRPLLAVQHRVVGEVGGRVGLIRRHQIDERRLGHRLQRVVRAALLADRRHRLLADRLAAERPGAVGRIDQARVRQRQQLRAQRIVEQRRRDPPPTTRARRADPDGRRRR